MGSGGFAAAILIRGGVLGRRGGLTASNLAVVLVVVVVASSCGCVCRGQRCHDEERRALLELKEESMASNYFAEDGQEDCCRWSDITCSNHTGRVVGIYLSTAKDDTRYPNFASLVKFRELERLTLLVYRIRGAALKVVCNLRYLEELSLYIWGSLEGPIPHCFCNMRSLRSLHLYLDSLNNGVLGMPSCLGNLHNLRILHLTGINIDSTTFLDGLCNLRLLKELHLDSLQGPIPQCLCSMRSLTDIELSYNHLNGSIPSCLGNLHDLERLNLKGNKISGTFPDGLCNLRRLKELDFGWNSLEGHVPRCLCSMRSLTNIELSYNHLNGSVPSCLGNLQDLERLHLASNNISGNFPDGLCNLRRLKELDFSWNSLEGRIPRCLCNVHSLTNIDLFSNRLRGSIPSCLGSLHNLLQLDLMGNAFEGSILPSIFPNLTKLQSVSIGGDQLEGTLPFSVFANLSDLKSVWISSDHGLELEIENPISWVPSFQLTWLNVSGCMINKGHGGRFPTSFISTQTRLSHLELVDDRMTGTVPLGVLCNSSLSYLLLGENMLRGLLPPACRNASSPIFYIDLSHNHLSGSLPSDVGLSFPNLAYLYMGGNQLQGAIPPSLGQAPLSSLDLSDNLLSGPLPHTLTRNQTTLIYLNVSYNQLDGGMLPNVDTCMPKLEFLFLQHNHFTGSIPPKISNCSLLKALDVGYNGLACSLSHCLPSFPAMIALSLTKNHLGGRLPSHLCQMQHLHLLDLSRNNLTGKIPPCLGNVSFWKSSNLRMETQDMLHWILGGKGMMQFTSKNSLLPYQGVPLTWMTELDVSSNQLDGAIPREIGELKGLQTLNLSNNLLQGPLPPSIGNMERLESLDLSRNNLSGTIPREMIELHFLSVFSVAFNNLSGVIPYNTQFSTFSRSSYEGNPELCGAPLERNCSSDVNMSQDQKQGEEGPSLLDNPALFYAWLILSFAAGFWGFIATVVFNMRWRITYLRAVDRFLAGFQRRF